MGLRTKLANRKENNKGFTLVELIVVIVILAILAAILIPGLMKWIDEARDKQYQLEARSIFMATEGEMTKEYGKQSTLTETTTWTGDTDAHIVEIERLSGLDVKEVKFKIKDASADDWTITEFETKFVSGGKEVTWHWKASENEWKEGAGIA
ncbi:MAG: prepilin-type N-terminal cleavage/methylation domain-containing protein [Lachnospiraceae bacterium]|nr:prepilin-type N-terminal cleavage/methylation domain-containing protein [Lachnospiraceae bacterium]